MTDRASDGWVLVVDAEQRPQGWISAATVSTDTGNVAADLLNLGGTLAAEGASLREALDAALSSPSGRGVIVRADGTLLGTVTASQVLTRIEQERAVTPVAQ